MRVNEEVDDDVNDDEQYQIVVEDRPHFQLVELRQVAEVLRRDLELPRQVHLQAVSEWSTQSHV